MDYTDFINLARRKYTEQPQLRWGQTLFNTLYDVRPDLAREVTATPLDPYYMQVNEVHVFTEWLAGKLT